MEWLTKTDEKLKNRRTDRGKDWQTDKQWMYGQ
jgi:hypothetical protein